MSRMVCAASWSGRSVNTTNGRPCRSAQRAIASAPAAGRSLVVPVAEHQGAVHVEHEPLGGQQRFCTRS